MEWNNTPVSSGLPATLHQNTLVKTKYSFPVYRDQLFFSVSVHRSPKAMF